MRASKEIVSKAFRAVLERYHINESEAARRLDVHRESFNKYVRGRTVPNRHALARAAELWGPVMAEYGIGAPSGAAAARSRPTQLKLFSEDLEGTHASIRIESKSAAGVELALMIRIA